MTIPFAKTAVAFLEPGGTIVGEPAAWLGRHLAAGPVRREVELQMNAERVRPELREGIELACSVLAAAGVWWQRHEDATSASGSAEGQGAERQAGSKRDLPPLRIGTREASRMLGVTARQVRYLADSGELPGRKENGRWRLDRAAVEAEAERKRREAA